MRFVLSLILLSFSFFSPFHGNAGEVLGKQSTANIENYGTPKPSDYSISDDYVVANINFNHRNISTNQYRFYPFNNLINTVAFQNKIDFFMKKNFLPSRTYTVKE